MRVLHVIPSLSPVHGGPSRALPLMEDALLQLGVLVETATTDDDGPGKRRANLAANPVQEDGKTRWYFPKQTELYKVSLPMSRWLRENVKRYDVVHVHALFSHTSLAAARAARDAGVPYVIRPLGVLNRYGMGNRRAWFKRRSLRWFEGPLLNGAACIHFTSESERVEAEMLGVPFRCKIIPVGLPLPQERAEAKVRERLVASVCRVDPVKNLEGLLDAWSVLRPAFTEWRLAIAGDGEARYGRQLQDLARSLGVENSVEWLGRIELGQKNKLLERASLFVLPSFSENFGIAAVEAMAAGLPCLLGEGVAVGSEAEPVGACRVTKPDADCITRNLRELMQDVELRAELGRSAREFVEREYSFAAMGRRLASLYDEVTSQK